MKSDIKTKSRMMGQELLLSDKLLFLHPKSSLVAKRVVYLTQSIYLSYTWNLELFHKANQQAKAGGSNVVLDLRYWLSSGDVHSRNRASKLCVSWVYAWQARQSEGRSRAGGPMWQREMKRAMSWPLGVLQDFDVHSRSPPSSRSRAQSPTCHSGPPNSMHDWERVLKLNS